MSTAMKWAWLAAGCLLLGSCGYDLNADTDCTDHHCGLSPSGSGGYRSCHAKADAKANCYLQDFDGRTFACTATCDCTSAQAQIDSWCSALR
jgi:hypothetical protein